MKQSARRLPPAIEGPLLDWLLNALRPMSRTSVKQLLKHGQIAVNGIATTRFDYPLRTGDLVTISAPQQHSLLDVLKRAGMPLIHIDDDLLIVDKPTDLLSVASEGEKANTAFAILNECLASERQGRAFTVHRLDRGTSGLLIFARSEAIRDQLQANWEGMHKTYLGIVEGCPATLEGTVRNYLVEANNLQVFVTSKEKADAKLAISHYRVQEKDTRYALVEVIIETGRKHQIRVHLAGLGCPVVGDRTYGAKTDPLGRLCLHASRLAFDHPTTKQRVEVEAVLPKILAKLVRKDPDKKSVL